MTRSKLALISVATLTTLFIAACGGVIDASIGGSVQGLSGGTTVGLLNNGVDPLTVSANTTFTFATQIQAGNQYNVTVGTQPLGETCTVQNGAGTVSQNHGDVTNVLVACNATTSASNYIFGTVSGLGSSKTVTLQDTVSNVTLPVSANGAFTFTNALSAGTAYNVTVSVQPAGQTCTVTSGSGTIPASGSPVVVTVTCI